MWFRSVKYIPDTILAWNLRMVFFCCVLYVVEILWSCPIWIHRCPRNLDPNILGRGMNLPRNPLANVEKQIARTVNPVFCLYYFFLYNLNRTGKSQPKFSYNNSVSYLAGKLHLIKAPIEFDKTGVSYVATGSPLTVNLAPSLASFKQENVLSFTAKSDEPNFPVRNTVVGIN